MKLTIIYATNSGSTFAACGEIAKIFNAKGHEVDIIEAKSANTASIKDIPGIIIASPSWDYEGQEGQPHEDITKFLSQLTAADFATKKVAVVGLGDTSYTKFCGAVEIIEQKLQDLHATLLKPSLKVDRYFTQPEAVNQVKTWAETMATNIAS